MAWEVGGSAEKGRMALGNSEGQHQPPMSMDGGKISLLGR